MQPNKAVVGANAFAHESGIPQDGVLKHRETYEIMRAQDVGWAQNKLVLGKHSGRNAFKSRLQELGIELESDEAVNAAFARFKDLADRKHEIFDEDLHALVSDEVVTPEQEHYKLLYSHVCSETGEMPHAKVILSVGGVEQILGELGGQLRQSLLQRLEAGDPGVGIGIVATALWLIKRDGELGNLATPEHDQGAIEMEVRAAVELGRARAKASAEARVQAKKN